MQAGHLRWAMVRGLAGRAFASHPSPVWQDTFINALACSEEQRLHGAKKRLADQWQGDQAANRLADANHHYNRSLQGLEGPNALGVHLTYLAHQKFRRGARGSWGLARRSVGRLKHLIDHAASP